MLRVFMAEYLNLKPQDFSSVRAENVVGRSESELVSVFHRCLVYAIALLH
jgi:hypothetical protein